MKHVFKLTAMAAVLAYSGIAAADPAETKGGIKIKTEDGRFEANVNGRIHFDGNIIEEDDDGAFGSKSNQAQSGFYFRRIYMTLSGKAYGWKYKVEGDFANDNATGATSIAFQDVLLSTEALGGEIQIGQRKPFRAMEDLTSSNDVLMIERPFASASAGMLSGGKSREFQDGLFYKTGGDNYTWGIGGYSLRALNTAGTEGVGGSTRLTFTPMQAEGSIVHLGVSYSTENPANDQGVTSSVSCTTATPPVCTTSGGAGANTPAVVGASMRYAGRRGPSFNLGSTNGELNTIGAEFATAMGPFFAQAEYMTQDQDDINGAGDSQTINAYYVQASFFVTGETKPYKKADGVFTNPKPISDSGAWEITARYDFAENSDFDGTTPTAGTSCGAGNTTCEVTSITAGVNYYLNPNVRFMLNYIMGEADKGNGKDEPNAIAARFQMAW